MLMLWVFKIRQNKNIYKTCEENVNFRYIVMLMNNKTIKMVICKHTPKNIPDNIS